ncbi:MAG: S41 family peptidase [Candidatus Berkelbacteria bacterium]|nr:S41 family peptidase [Candidatus Berkelbacteria bacterium]
MKKNKQLVIKIFTVLAAVVLFFYAGYGFGVRRGSNYSPPSYIQNSSKDKLSDVDFSLFWQTWNKVRELYNGSSDPQTMVYGAISGMVSSLGDPYTVFLKPSDNDALTSDLSGQFEGIGAELTMLNNQVTVIAPLASSPAEKAGIKAKDIILQVDGISVENMTLNEVISKIRGKAGTDVKLQMVHLGSDQPIELTITRQNIKIDSVTYKTVTLSNKKIAILKISQFGDDTVNLANKYADQMKKDGVAGIILDLRNNPGGYLDSSVSVAGLLLAKDKLIVSEVDKNGTKTEYKANGSSQLVDYPLVVLVNGGSASAAEILTGAIKDNNRGEIIGEKTFGKGCVQQLEPLACGAALKVTIANWLTPNGSQINKIGITPDNIVQLSDTDSAAGRDPQLDKAKTEIIR